MEDRRLKKSHRFLKYWLHYISGSFFSDVVENKGSNCLSFRGSGKKRSYYFREFWLCWGEKGSQYL